VFASAFVTVEWLPEGECALLKLTTMPNSSGHTMIQQRQFSLLTARPVSFLTAACGMDNLFSVPFMFCQFDSGLDTVFVLGK
jgi:hypothetical protein